MRRIVLSGCFTIAACFISVNQISAATISAGGLESFLGLAANTLSNLEQETVVSGSATKQSFTAQAGDVLSFDYKFVTNESAGGNGDSKNDFAFIGISPLFTSVLADTFSPLNRSDSTDFARETAFQHYSTVIQQAGTYNLNLGVVNAGDGLLNSGLVVDNVSLSHGGISSPQFSGGDFEHGEPAAMQATGDVGTTTDFPNPSGGNTQLLLNATISAVPEPSSLAIAASACVAGLAFTAMRRRRSGE